MPVSPSLLSILTIVLQYSLLFLIYFILWRVIRLAWKETTCTSVVGTASVPSASHLSCRLVLTEAAAGLIPQEFPITESLSIGRNGNNDVIVNDAFVSAEHACLTVTKKGCILTDMNSTNGTFVNGAKIDVEVLLSSGDRITIGPVTFRFEG